ncbi:minor capsid protein [Streptomyces sp. NPDC101132]|uniref:minor capsid protein n=1 Tax=Streptomyces sp. NPDC101132 TaxID=3366110 RepID=UPI0037FEF446
MADEPDLLDGLARYLAERGHGTYGPDLVGATIVLEHMPSTPDVVVVLTEYGGPEAHGRLPYDEPRVQIRVRGTTDPRVSRARAKAIRSELHGLSYTVLPGGTELLSAVALQTVESMGQDDNRRHEHVFNLQTEIYSPTKHRA